jgi:hypothetical protein
MGRTYLPIYGYFVPIVCVKIWDYPSMSKFYPSDVYKVPICAMKWVKKWVKFSHFFSQNLIFFSNSWFFQDFFSFLYFLSFFIEFHLSSLELYFLSNLCSKLFINYNSNFWVRTQAIWVLATDHNHWAKLIWWNQKVMPLYQLCISRLWKFSTIRRSTHSE